MTRWVVVWGIVLCGVATWPSFATAAPPAVTVIDVEKHGTIMGGHDALWFSKDGNTLACPIDRLIAPDLRLNQPPGILAISLPTRRLSFVPLARPKGDSPFLPDPEFSRDGAKLTCTDYLTSPRGKGKPGQEREATHYVLQWNSSSGKLTQQIQPPGGEQAIAIHGNGRTVLSAVLADKQIRFRVWDLLSRKKQAEFVLDVADDDQDLGATRFSPRGDRVAVGRGNSIMVYEAATGELATTLKAESPTAHLDSPLYFSPDGDMLSAMFNDGADAITLWHVDSGERQLTVEARELDPAVAKKQMIQELESLRDRQRIREKAGLAGDDGALTKQEDEVRRRYAKGRESLALGPISPNGTFLAVGRPGEVVLVDVETGEVEQTLSVSREYAKLREKRLQALLGDVGPLPAIEGDEDLLHTHPIVFSMAFSLDGSKFAVGEMDAVFLYTLRTAAAKGKAPATAPKKAPPLPSKPPTVKPPSQKLPTPKTAPKVKPPEEGAP